MIYSYHSFILPFTCIYEGNIYELFDNNNADNIWKYVDKSVESNSLREINIESIYENKGYYDAYKFFNEAGRNLVFSDSKTKNSHNYGLRNEYLSGLKYYIKYGNSKKEVYELNIHKITLKFFETGVSVFILECANESYRTIEDVKRINEYGRRLAYPYWPEKGGFCHKCAFSLKIGYSDERDELSSDYFLDELISKKIQVVSLAYVSKIVRELLNRNGSGYIFRGKTVSSAKEIQMKTLLEEKMFVASFICDKNYCQKLYDNLLKNNGNFSEDIKDNIIELLRVDLPGECSIGNKEERDIFLKDHLYLTSFSEKDKKIMAVTDQAYVKIVPSPDYEEGYFKNVYLPLLLIPLVQRNTIEIFHQKIMELTNSASEKVNLSIVRRIINVQNKYVIFRNQFMPGLVTAQKEGKYLYSKLQSELAIPEENKVLESQVGKLFELANTNQSYAFSKWGLSLSLTSLTISFISFLNTAQSISKIGFENYSGIPVVLLTISIILVIIFSIIFGVFSRKRGNR